MFFNGSLYITDPCYLRLADDWGELDEDIVIRECSKYFIKYTGVGDGNWKVFAKFDEEPVSFHKMRKMIERGDHSGFEEIGEYCVDSCHVCLVYKNEADAACPGFVKEFEDKRFCYTEIKDFVGEIEVYEDKDYVRHFIGKGNICFFTAE